MGKNNNKIKPGWYIPVSVKESFADFCTEKGCIIQEDCAGALVIWQYLPAQIRESARLEAKGKPSVDKQFWNDFSEGLEMGIRAQLKNQQHKPPKKK